MTNHKNFEGVSSQVRPPHTYPVLSFIIGVMALSILVAAGVFAYTTYLRYEEEQVTSSFVVQGEASQQIDAREARLNFAVVRRGDDGNVLNQEVDAVASRIREYLNGLGLTGNDIQINKQTYPEFREGPASPVESAEGEAEIAEASSNQGQVVEAVFDVKIDNLDEINLNDVLREVTALGAERIAPTDFQVGNKEGVCETLTNQAIEDALGRAQKRLGSLGGETIVRTEVTENGGCGQSYFGPYFAENADSATQSVPAPDILSGQEELRVRVSLKVEYR